jgi:hypothetical protein
MSEAKPYTDEEMKYKDFVLSEYEKGNIVVLTHEGAATTPIKEFVKQPVNGILYDLNRGEEVVLTFINDPKWINDYAVAKTIRELSATISERDAEISRLKKLVKEAHKDDNETE